MNEEKNASKELCLNDPNSAGDSRALENLETFGNSRFEKSSESNDDRCFEDLEPFETVEKLGTEMKELFSNWSEGFIPSKQFEEEVLKSMDNLKNQAYMLEAEFLENKLELIKKRIIPTD